MREWIRVITYGLFIIIGVVCIIISKKANFKKQSKGYEIDPKVYNEIIKETIRKMGYIYIVIGFISFFNNTISLILPTIIFIPSIKMSSKIKVLAKKRRRIDKLV